MPAALSYTGEQKALLLSLILANARELADEGGVDALINRSRRAPNLKNRTDEATEQAVVDYAVAFPTHGQHRASNELRKQGVFISDSGVRSVWLLHNLENLKRRY